MPAHWASHISKKKQRMLFHKYSESVNYVLQILCIESVAYVGRYDFESCFAPLSSRMPAHWTSQLSKNKGCYFPYSESVIINMLSCVQSVVYVCMILWVHRRLYIEQATFQKVKDATPYLEFIIITLLVLVSSIVYSFYKSCFARSTDASMLSKPAFKKQRMLFPYIILSKVLLNSSTKLWCLVCVSNTGCCSCF